MSWASPGTADSALANDASFKIGRAIIHEERRELRFQSLHGLPPGLAMLPAMDILLSCPTKSGSSRRKAGFEIFAQTPRGLDTIPVFIKRISYGRQAIRAQLNRTVTIIEKSRRAGLTWAFALDATCAAAAEPLLKAAIALSIWGRHVVAISSHNGRANPVNLTIENVRAGLKPTV